MPARFKVGDRVAYYEGPCPSASGGQAEFDSGSRTWTAAPTKRRSRRSPQCWMSRIPTATNGQ